MDERSGPIGFNDLNWRPRVLKPSCLHCRAVGCQRCRLVRSVGHGYLVGHFRVVRQPIEAGVVVSVTWRSRSEQFNALQKLDVGTPGKYLLALVCDLFDKFDYTGRVSDNRSSCWKGNIGLGLCTTANGPNIVTLFLKFYHLILIRWIATILKAENFTVPNDVNMSCPSVLIPVRGSSVNKALLPER